MVLDDMRVFGWVEGGYGLRVILEPYVGFSRIDGNCKQVDHEVETEKPTSHLGVSVSRNVQAGLVNTAKVPAQTRSRTLEAPACGLRVWTPHSPRQQGKALRGQRPPRWVPKSWGFFGQQRCSEHVCRGKKTVYHQKMKEGSREGSHGQSARSVWVPSCCLSSPLGPSGSLAPTPAVAPRVKPVPGLPSSSSPSGPTHCLSPWKPNR